jgi:uncharacterized protein YxjI
MTIDSLALTRTNELYVKQVFELGELFGFETRNKYAINDAHGQAVAYAAEQQKGVLGFLLRQFLGHWRPFDITFFNSQRQPFLRASHPFRFFFQRLEVFEPSGRAIGAIQQRFALFSKKFDVLDAQGNVLLEMRSGLFRPWTFPFERAGQQQALIEKKWSGVLGELFTDKDNFRVKFESPSLTSDQRSLILAAAIFVDLQYFERHE